MPGEKDVQTAVDDVIDKAEEEDIELAGVVIYPGDMAELKRELDIYGTDEHHDDVITYRGHEVGKEPSLEPGQAKPRFQEAEDVYQWPRERD